MIVRFAALARKMGGVFYFGWKKLLQWPAEKILFHPLSTHGGW